MADVTYPEAVTTKLRRWAGIARQIGLGAAYAAALREMDERLRADPEAWGDPVKDYHGARLTRYHRYGPILFVDYAVHINGTPVFVRDVRLTPGTSLSDAAK